MRNRSNALADAAVAVLVVSIAYWAYAARDLLALIGGAALCAVVSQPLIEAASERGFGQWRPTRFQSLLIVLASVGAILLIIAGLAPWLARSSRELSLTGQAFKWLGGLLDRIPSPNSAALYLYFTRATIVAVAWLLITTVLARRRQLAAARGAGVEEPTLSAGNHRLTGALALAICAGVSSFVALGLLGVPHYYAFAVLAAGATIVPVAGPFATVFFCAAALAGSAAKLAAMLAYFFVYYELENSLIRPLARDPQRSTGLLAIVISLMLGMTIAGLAGAIIAIPAGAIAATLLGSLLSPREIQRDHLDVCAACELQMQHRGELTLPVAAEPAGSVAPPAAVAAVSRGGVCAASLIEMVVAGLAALLAFRLLDLRYPYELAALTGLGTAIPPAGPLAAALASAAVAGSGSTSELVGVLVFFLCYFQIARWLVTPRWSGIIVDVPMITRF